MMRLGVSSSWPSGGGRWACYAGSACRQLADTTRRATDSWPAEFGPRRRHPPPRPRRLSGRAWRGRGCRGRGRRGGGRNRAFPRAGVRGHDLIDRAGDRWELGLARPAWLGTRVLPLRPDGFGEVTPTPAELVDRRLPTIDLLAPPTGDAFRCLFRTGPG